MLRPKIAALPQGYYELMGDFTFSNSEGTWIVPDGFIFNGASIPRIPFVYAAYGGKALEASCLHDYLYWQRKGRKTADKAFLAEMSKFGNPKSSLGRRTMYLAVRLFGWTTY